MIYKHNLKNENKICLTSSCTSRRLLYVQNNARVNDDSNDEWWLQNVQRRASVVAAFPFPALFALLDPLSNGRNGSGVGNGAPKSRSAAGQQVADVQHGKGRRIGVQFGHQPAQNQLQAVALLGEGLGRRKKNRLAMGTRKFDRRIQGCLDRSD